MRLYTIKHHENECVAVKTKAGRLCTLKSLGFDVKDMNALSMEKSARTAILPA